MFIKLNTIIINAIYKPLLRIISHVAVPFKTPTNSAKLVDNGFNRFGDIRADIESVIKNIPSLV